MTKQTKQQTTQEEPAKTEDIQKAQATPVKKKKSLFKPFLFFAIFILCLEGAMLYPLVEHDNRAPLPAIPPKQPVLEIAPSEAVISQEQTCPECECPQPEVIVQDCELPQQEKDNAALIASLKEQIHHLEIENLSLKEQKTTFEDTTPELIKLLQNIYTGKPFDSQLEAILKQDKRNSFALAVRKSLGNYADKGIPTADDVKHLFDSKFQIALDSFYMTADDESYMTKATNIFKSMVHVYPKDLNKTNAKGISWLYLARQQVAKNDFAGAVESISHTPPQVRSELKAFSDAAEIRIRAKKIIEERLGK